MELLHITPETLTELQTFNSVEEMDEAIKTYKQTHKLTKTDRDILDAISRYACKYKGVCYLSKQKIAEAAGYKSRRTAIRACNRLEALGIIKQYETRRIKGDKRRSTNVIVINNVIVTENKQEQTAKVDNEVQQVTSTSHDKETPAKAIKLNNTYKETAKGEPSNDQVIKRGLRNAIPKPIYDALSPFFNGQGLYNVYGILLRAKAKIDRSIRLEEYGSRYIDAFYNVIRLYKAGRVTSLNGLLYVAWERLTAEISRQINASKSALFNDFCAVIG